MGSWLTVILGLAIAAPAARADEIYRAVNGSGQRVYSNLPLEGAEHTDAVVESATAQGAEPADAPAGVAPGGADDGFSTSASLQRRALEHDIRDADRQLHALDEQLATLARVRNQNARGSAATGGVRAAASDVTTDEERTIAAQRDQLKQHASQLRESYGKLRDEVTAKLGGTPDWWVELR